MKREHPFATEADLCAAFIAWAKPQGWTAYAETCGWDVLLVHGDGAQIGVQAKLRFNLDVLTQAVEKTHRSDRGPDFRAIVVPRGGCRDICDALGITTISYTETTMPGSRFYPELPLVTRAYHYNDSAWQCCNHAKRHELPDYVPDVTAGSSGPIQLTRWKIEALKVVARLELRGFVTRADFHHYGIDPRRWINDSDWLRPGAAPGQFVRGPGLNFDTQHPQVYPQVRADVERELRAAGVLELSA